MGVILQELQRLRQKGVLTEASFRTLEFVLKDIEIKTEIPLILLTFVDPNSEEPAEAQGILGGKNWQETLSIVSITQAAARLSESDADLVLRIYKLFSLCVEFRGTVN